MLTPGGLYLLELKHWQGEISGDGIQWQRRTPNGKTRVVDNPLLLANRKAKRLASLLAHYADRPSHQLRTPYVGAAIFLHASNLRVSLDSVGRQHIYGPRNAAGSGLPGIDVLLRGERPGVRMDREQARAIVRLIEAAGVRPAVADRTVGQLTLEPRPYAEGPGWQDYLARHQVQNDQVRRVRFYLATQAAPAERDMITRAAEREYRILQDIHHDGIVHAVDMVEHGYGPAVIFEHEESSVRLDRWIDEHRASLPPDRRLALVREFAEIMRYAHSRRLVHRNLNPRSILVQRPESTRPRLVVIDWQTGGRLLGSSQPTLGGSDLLSGTIHIEQLATRLPGFTRRRRSPTRMRPGRCWTCSRWARSLPDLDWAGAGSERGRAADPAGGGRRAGCVGSFDAAPPRLVDLIFDATLGVASGRTQSVADFLAHLEALRMGHNYIGTEHILLALLELQDGTGVLAHLGIDKATAEANITAALVAHQQK